MRQVTEEDLSAIVGGYDAEGKAVDLGNVRAKEIVINNAGPGTVGRNVRVDGDLVITGTRRQ
jgi:hypothetical protein